MHVVGAGLGLLFVLCCILAGLFLFIFWIWALINAITNPRLGGGEKVAWVLVIIFLHFLGALVYVLVGRKA